ncbi:hypothetical protein HN014_04270 [Aquimarina sp. TRL1]|uniref:hypothetical protein n=1 Tax=Aquimarina sp. (strain TRL1) TaxID=2736252 RepID=UPI00158A776E|nr:hypothetical protein [Aquimarina sp. TRL1]QKX04154.1 hypothetical protein HN014_04270 [Aquimarina sp. TRL1]
MKNNSTTTQNKYLIFIVNSLHMDITSFMHNLSYGDTYEVLIYRWTNKLYNKGISKEQALKIIYRARCFALPKYPIKKNNTPKSSQSLPELLLNLHTHPTYNRLSNQTKKQVIKKMETVYNSNQPFAIDRLLEKFLCKSPKKKRSKISWFF